MCQKPDCDRDCPTLGEREGEREREGGREGEGDREGGRAGEGDRE